MRGIAEPELVYSHVVLREERGNCVRMGLNMESARPSVGVEWYYVRKMK